jgi:hypothetical protein
MSNYYLTDSYRSPVPYFTGNGMNNSYPNYGKLIALNSYKYHYFISDIELFGNYVIFGPLFVIGVLSICIKTIRI